MKNWNSSENMPFHVNLRCCYHMSSFYLRKNWNSKLMSHLKRRLLKFERNLWTKFNLNLRIKWRVLFGVNHRTYLTLLNNPSYFYSDNKEKICEKMKTNKAKLNCWTWLEIKKWDSLVKRNLTQFPLSVKSAFIDSAR